jgi:hypothetical protein
MYGKGDVVKIKDPYSLITSSAHMPILDCVIIKEMYFSGAFNSYSIDIFADNGLAFTCAGFVNDRDIELANDYETKVLKTVEYCTTSKGRTPLTNSLIVNKQYNTLIYMDRNGQI